MNRVVLKEAQEMVLGGELTNQFETWLEQKDIELDSWGFDDLWDFMISQGFEPVSYGEEVL